MAFDEAMLPSRSSFNRTCVYMEDEHHKWGTKLFMLCCSKTACCIRYIGCAFGHAHSFFLTSKLSYHALYTILILISCMHRFEVYLGKRQTDEVSDATDFKSGPAVVVRNLRHVFGHWIDFNATCCHISILHIRATRNAAADDGLLEHRHRHDKQTWSVQAHYREKEETTTQHKRGHSQLLN